MKEGEKEKKKEILEKETIHSNVRRHIGFDGRGLTWQFFTQLFGHADRKWKRLLNSIQQRIEFFPFLKCS